MREEMEIVLEIKGNTGYTVVNNEIINDPSISYKALGIFTYLLSRGNDWSFYMSEIEENSTDRTSAIRSGVVELEEAGYVKRERMHSNIKTQYKWTLYPLKQRTVENRVCENQRLVNREVISINNISKDNTNNTIYSFADFWNDYGIKKSRKACERKYKKLSETKRKLIKESLPAYLQENADPKYRKHPATFLNNESWEDEALTAGNSQPQIERPMGLR